jgi:hypothetical protein
LTHREPHLRLRPAASGGCRYVPFSPSSPQPPPPHGLRFAFAYLGLCLALELTFGLASDFQFIPMMVPIVAMPVGCHLLASFEPRAYPGRKPVVAGGLVMLVCALVGGAADIDSAWANLGKLLTSDAPAPSVRTLEPIEPVVVNVADAQPLPTPRPPMTGSGRLNPSLPPTDAPALLFLASGVGVLTALLLISRQRR